MKANIPFSHILCDPINKSDLELIEESELKSNLGDSYKVINNIPILLKEGLSDGDLNILIHSKQKTGFSWAEKHWFDLRLNELVTKPQHEGARLLSFGSGSPLEKKFMSELGYTVISLDINPKYKGVDVIGDGHHLPFKDNSFDVVAAFEVLEHLHSPWLAIQEIARVLKPGGEFIGSVAFLKEFHSSYFHMSHWGVISLLNSANLECEKVYGGQNVYGRLISQLLPLGPKKISEKVYNAFGNMVFSLRKNLWSLKKKQSYKSPKKEFDMVEFSFEDFDKTKFAPTIVFKSKKMNKTANQNAS